jgi:BirA family biotin operon repressor/biotin-[acetyl-CoA-carboxylase] ligase
VGLVRGLRAAGLEGVSLKWPNDVLCHYHKLAGILIEVHGDMLGPSAAVIGIGLNVKLSDSTRSRIDQPVTDVYTVTGRWPDRNALLGGLLVHLADVLEHFEASGFSGLREEWQASHAYHGRPVRLILPGGECREGRVSGVSDDGSLLLENASGQGRFISGEISLRPL